MKTSLRFLAPLLVLLAIAFSSREAHALGPIDIEVGAKVGYGGSPGGAAINPLGLGLGGRAGISLFGIYVGGNIIKYLGSGDNLGGQYSALEYGAEVGYGFKISILTIRPQIGLGNIEVKDSQPNPLAPPSGNSFYLEPGVTALLTFGLLYIGADANALVITSEPAYGSGGSLVLSTSTNSAFTFHGQVGITF